MFDHPFYINVRENRRADQEWTNDTGNIGHKTQNRRADQEWTIEWHRQHWEQDTEPKGRSRVNNWMTQATLGTRHRTEGPIKNEQLNDAVNIGNKTQNEDKQNKQTHHRKLKRRTPPRHFWQCWHSCYILFHTFHLQITFLT